MAPTAMVAEAYSPLPTFSKASTVSASVLHGPCDLRLEVRSIEDPGAGEVQVAIRSTGICGSDVSYYKKFANGDLCACMPLSLGHESSGVIVALGPQVTGFKIGDRIALEVGVACGSCTVCRKGRYNLCKQMRFRSSAKSVPHFQGTLQERINHPAQWCHKLPDHVSFDAAALLEPLSVAIHAVNRASPLPGSTALVIGAGTVGLLTAAVARASGCSEVTITDVDEGRVNYAIAKGFATHGLVAPRPLNLSPSSSSIYTESSGTSTPAESGATTPASIFSLSSQLDGAKSLAADLLALTAPPAHLLSDEENEGFDLSFECTGKEVCMRTSLYATKPGGKVVMVGMGTPIQTLPLSVAHLREIDIIGIFRYANTYATGICMLCSGAIPSLDDMVTHRFKGLDAAKSAFELACRTADKDGNLVIKVVIEASTD
ncbi:zinc-dependent alcohol dehydrogenase [Grosmannia clavigera kw1407]|uniref:Zinc-dependent alcohol dehydrogenase n=1 Tax=Grosmannia clavigera (strain kw1407 / UAMH 11150) TaxID=655863 RepID=F0X8L5_GROCL|nr:zinc-dependent alcohol dehydrogenase [Grosmannia clavigera kw1407]EFX05633.1 zinc-dependent alcohol dehydrogenase [Grosmannia clavigera kw1407]